MVLICLLYDPVSFSAKEHDWKEFGVSLGTVGAWVKNLGGKKFFSPEHFLSWAERNFFHPWCRFTKNTHTHGKYSSNELKLGRYIVRIISARFPLLFFKKWLYRFSWRKRGRGLAESNLQIWVSLGVVVLSLGGKNFFSPEHFLSLGGKKFFSPVWWVHCRWKWMAKKIKKELAH